MSAAIAAATADQPLAGKALAAAAAEPFHAYLFAGPRGSGKGAAARALAAELLADGAVDPGDARRRALADPSPHPDLTWLRPPGTQHLVETVRERVIAQIAYRPFEGERRVFVIEDADAMAEESQNALLKTLEEPPAFAHLILVSAEPEALLETVRSRCRVVRFARLGPDAVEARLEGADSDAERRAAARLSGGDLGMASFLVTEEGRRLRAGVEALARAVRCGELADAPWTELASAADAAGEREAGVVRDAGRGGGRGVGRALGPRRPQAQPRGGGAGEARLAARPQHHPRHRAGTARVLDARPGRGRRGWPRARPQRRSRRRARRARRGARPAPCAPRR